MTTPTNWPNPERPGWPLQPEKGGWHWLSVGDAAPIPVEWNADHAPVAFDDWGWALGDYDDGLHSPEKAAKSMRYHGPCLTPTQISEMLAGERERCLAACQSAKVPVDGWGDPIDDGDADRNEGIDDAMAAIRKLGAAS